MRRVSNHKTEARTSPEPSIVVGVDGSEGSLRALRAAFEEARLRKAPLRVVVVWQLTWSEIAVETPETLKQAEDQAERVLDAALASVADGAGSAVEVSGELVNGHAATALVEAARDATLLVVGTRGTGGVAGALVGSVAHAAIHHARCPVLVVPR
jgi:nucleotide-binding universal stress UspA family protein